MPTTHYPSRTLPIRAVVLGLLVALAATAVPFWFAGASRDGSQASARSARELVTPQMQAVVSAAIGRDDAAYRVKQSRDAVGVVNRRHGLDARFTAAGARVRSGDRVVKVSLEATGRGARLRSVNDVRPVGSRNRVEYRRAGVTEWYVNGPLGLEQGFTIPRRLAGASPGPLTLSLALSGDVRPRLEGRRTLTLSRRLSYRGLWAADARGRDLPAWLELQRGRLLLRVDDAGATYPVTVDPFFQGAKVTASDGLANDFFGTSVSLSGDTLVVGAPGDDNARGAAYVFAKPASGWADATQVAKLTASDGGAFHYFGVAVAIDGDTIAVGGLTTTAYVFVKPAGGWANAIQNAKLTVTDPNVSELGASVDIQGDVVVAGAPSSSPGGVSFKGAAYVFEKPGAGWSNVTQSSSLIAFGGGAGDLLGSSVAISGTSIVAGAYNDDNQRGSASIFNRPGATWALPGGGIEHDEEVLLAPDGLANDQFGVAVDISGPTVVVGAYRDAVGGQPTQGSAYVFERFDATTWPIKKHLTAADGAGTDWFGYAVSIAGNTIAVGAPRDTIGANVDQGSAYAFVNPGTGWENAVQTGKVTAADGLANDEFGYSVSYAAGVLASGARFSAVGANARQGSGYLHIEDSVPPAAPVLGALAPGSPANANTPSVIGSAEPESTVRLYASGDCSGTPLAEGAAAQFGAPGLSVSVTDNSVTNVRATATDRAGNVSPCTTGALTFVEDSAAPAAPAVNAPTRVITRQDARFTATADDGPGSGVAPEGIRWTASAGLAPQAGATAIFRFPSHGSYTLQVVAVDRAGNASAATSVTVPVLPLPRITSGIRKRFLVFKTYTVFTKLVVRDAPVGALVRVSCKGRGCPKKPARRRSEGRKEMPFTSYVKGRHLRSGAVLQIRITLAGHLGKVVKYRMRKGKRPVVTVQCLDPGASKPGACPKGS